MSGVMVEDKDDHLGHVVPQKTYLTVFIALLILTAITVGIAQYDFGSLNLVIAMFVASMKASLVILVFMHLKYENPITWLYAFFPVFLLFLLIGGVFIDAPLRKSPKENSVQTEAAPKVESHKTHH